MITEPSNDTDITPLPIKREPRQKLTNAQFAALPPAEKRVAIARDVLAWMATGKLTPDCLYMSVRDKDGKDITVPKVNGYTCQACALGAVMACAVERGLAETLQVEAWPQGAHEALAPYFTTRQLAEIEGAFELYTDTAGFHTVKAAAFGEAITRAIPGGVCKNWEGDDRPNKWVEGGPARRMRAIMTNIIDNGGTFVP